MSSMNPYETLGLPLGASDEEVQKTYRKMAMQWHPDRNGGSEEAATKFREINAAYEAITKGNVQPTFGFGVDDIFRQFFGGNPFSEFRQQRRRGADTAIEAWVEFLDAAKGCRTEISLTRSSQCPTCNGLGATQTETCSACKGQGMVSYRSGNMTVQTTCRTCNGLGKRVKVVCATCSGSGKTTSQQTINIDVPAGLKDGDRFRLAGYGEMADVPGDAYVILRIKEHPIFYRINDNLVVRHQVTFGQLVLGDTIQVPMLDGEATVTILPGHDLGMPLTIPDKGFKGGDCLVELKLDTSPPTDKKGKKIIEELRKWEKDDTKRIR